MQALRAFLILCLGATVARSEPVDQRPYPLLEFFLARQCIDRDVAVSTLLQRWGRTDLVDVVHLQQAYSLISRARRRCAAGRVAGALGDYAAAARALCEGRRRPIDEANGTDVSELDCTSAEFAPPLPAEEAP